MQILYVPGTPKLSLRLYQVAISYKIFIKICKDFIMDSPLKIDPHRASSYFKAEIWIHAFAQVRLPFADVASTR